jgi:hypothetical protein
MSLHRFINNKSASDDTSLSSTKRKAICNNKPKLFKIISRTKKKAFRLSEVRITEVLLYVHPLTVFLLTAHKGKGKGKAVSDHGMKAERRSIGTAPQFLTAVLRDECSASQPGRRDTHSTGGWQ